jgi:hypothetical protein
MNIDQLIKKTIRPTQHIGYIVEFGLGRNGFECQLLDIGTPFQQESNRILHIPSVFSVDIPNDDRTDVGEFHGGDRASTVHSTPVTFRQ